MNKEELKTVLNSLYGFTAMQLIQQVSAINALERTLEDIKNGAKWQSVDLAIEAAISSLESIKSGWSINSEHSETTKSDIVHDTEHDLPLRNIDRIRTMTSGEFGEFLSTIIYCCGGNDLDSCENCPVRDAKACTKAGLKEWLISPYKGVHHKGGF